MILKCGYTDAGGRKYNEDSGAILQRGKSLCAILADGLGGHGGGDVASHMAVDIIKKGFLEMKNQEISREDIDTWFEQANESIVAKQSRECQMKTTLAVLYLEEEKREAQWAHLGDSRIYHFVNGKEVSCTFDHSVSRMAVLSGEIKLEEVRFHEDRSKLLKVVGKEGMVRPEYGSCTLEEQAKHAFLLCSDGFWEYVTEEVMEQVLNVAETPQKWIEMMRIELAKHVDGTNDNNSAIAVFI